MLWRERLSEWIVRHAQGPYASPFLFAFSYAEALFSPLPVETVLVPLVLSRARSWIHYANLAAVASTLGGITGYIIGYFFYDTLGVWIIQSYSLADEALVIQKALSEHVFSATFVAAFTPLPDKVYMPIAGLLHVPLLLFIGALALGRIARSYLVAYVTHAYGPGVLRITLRYFTQITFIGFFLLLAVLVWAFFR